MVRGQDGKATLPQTQTPTIPVNPIIIGAALLLLSALGVGGVFLKDIITGGGGSNPIPTPSISSPTPSISPSSTPTTFDPTWISAGERTLNRTQANPFRDRGVEAFIAGNFAEAVTQFEKAVLGNRNDPELQIYLNNAKARLKGSPLVVATVVPIDNRLNIAQDMLRGMADAQTRFNDAGGAGGRLVEIMIANDGNEPARAQMIAQNLANNPNVLGVIGHNSSKASQAALPEYEKVGLAMISPTSTSDYLSGNVFLRTVPSDGESVKILAEYAKNKLSVQKIAVFYDPNSPFSKNLFEVFEKAFKQLGGEVYTAIDLTRQDLDVKQEIQSLRNHVTAIILFPDPSNISNAISLAQANAQVSGTKFQLLGGNSLYGSDILTSGGNAIEGLIIAVPWVANNQPYAQAAYQRWGGAINWRTASSFDATIALLKALSENPTRASVLQDLKATNLPASETSGQQLQFNAQGERQEESMLVKVTKGAPNRPPNVDYGFQLIQ
ncbi:amino acid ABC transporter substrate-binding protein [Microcystis aeruginosa BLCCF158]|uniref:Amino acid ABC transporter substrate-binding protein n=1 Tax=Microcystis aeruginosa BLCC-F158 TaxID=2755316 RepID=A0A841UVB3_MICAE|nr:ABC transporter substrate-binding protein [Microcystis aeruginosa]MBC1194482.1 amino acid ABC transporter substrate-binding protein [Microcystis aeruginosa BLCC-F158]